MDTAAILGALRDDLLAGADLTTLRAHLVKFRDAGGTQEAMIGQLEALRRESDDGSALDDRILDLLDITTNFCRKSLCVW